MIRLYPARDVVPPHPHHLSTPIEARRFRLSVPPSLQPVPPTSHPVFAPLPSPPPAERDEERLEELRELNRETKKTTGEYMSDEEIAEFRTPKAREERGPSPRPHAAAPPVGPRPPVGRSHVEAPPHPRPPRPLFSTPQWTDRREFVDND